MEQIEGGLNLRIENYNQVYENIVSKEEEVKDTRWRADIYGWQVDSVDGVNICPMEAVSSQENEKKRENLNQNRVR